MKTKSLSLKILSSIVLILLLNLFFLYYLKYSNNQLSFSDLSFTKTGNVLNLLFTLITVFGFFIAYLKKLSLPIKFIYLLLILLNLFLFIVQIVNSLSIPAREYYFSSLSFTQVLVVFAFALFQFLQLFLMLFVWLKILRVENLIYIRSAVNSFFLGLGLLVFTIIFINTGSQAKIVKKNGNEKINVAVVLGAAVWSDNKPSPSLASRADKAAELYKKGVVQKIQLTGGNAPGELSEAEVALNYVLKKGVERNDIWLEKKTTSSVEQARFIKNELLLRKKIDYITIVSDKYHLSRVHEICKFYNLNADFTASKLTLKTDKIIFYQLRECFALLMFWFFGI